MTISLTHVFDFTRIINKKAKGGIEIEGSGSGVGLLLTIQAADTSRPDTKKEETRGYCESKR